MSKRIPEFFKPQEANMTSMTVAQLLGTQMQEMHKMSMRTILTINWQLCAKTKALIDHEASQRAAANDSFAARLTTLEHANTALSERVAVVERSPAPPVPPTPPAPPAPPAAPAAAAPVVRKVNKSHAFINKSISSGKVRYHIQFKNKHVILSDFLPRGANSFVTLQDCLRARDRIILASGCVLFEGNVRGRLGKLI